MAKDVAGYLVECYALLGAPISNMKLQKLLYYAWVEYYKKTKRYLFDDPISVWRFGPVVETVYYKYRIYAAMPILRPSEDYDSTKLDDSVKSFLNDLAQKYIDHTTLELMFRDHKSDSAWFEMYGSEKQCNRIPFEKIIERDIINQEKEEAMIVSFLVDELAPNSEYMSPDLLLALERAQFKESGKELIHSVEYYDGGMVRVRALLTLCRTERVTESNVEQAVYQVVDDAIRRTSDALAIEPYSGGWSSRNPEFGAEDDIFENIKAWLLDKEEPISINDSL